ncbi:MAG: helix-turn-helix domain-containing protein [Leucobacter sp.]|nr:helix-turn-helix domain-containing protein [Leucobacter sp.]
MSRDVAYYPPREYRDPRAWAVAASRLIQTAAIAPFSTGEGFRLRAEAAALGSIRLAHLESGPYAHERRGPAAELPEPTFTLTLQRRGTSRIVQSGGRVELGAGDFTITDSSRPYRREYPTAAQVLVVVFPQRFLSVPTRSLAHLVGTSMPGSDGLGAIASRLLGGIADNLPALRDPLGLTLIDTALDVVSTLLAARALGAEATGTPVWELLEIRDYIMEHLDDPALSPAVIARENFISERRLHHLFQGSGSTVSGWVRERRLEMCRRELADPAVRCTVREIGERWGFSNQTHFARVFRATYGCSPSELRLLGRLPEDA